MPRRSSIFSVFQAPPPPPPADDREPFSPDAMAMQRALDAISQARSTGMLNDGRQVALSPEMVAVPSPKILQPLRDGSNRAVCNQAWRPRWAEQASKGGASPDTCNETTPEQLRL